MMRIEPTSGPELPQASKASIQFCSSFAFEKLFAFRKDYVRGQISEHVFSPNGGFLYMSISKLYLLQSVYLGRAGAQYILRKKAFSQSGRDYEIVPFVLDLCSGKGKGKLHSARVAHLATRLIS